MSLYGSASIMINLGIVGTGHIFKKQLEALSTLNNEYNLVAVCDTNPEHLSACGLPKEIQYSNYHSFIQAPGLNTIMISTPPATHYELTKAALNAGKNVLLEKPAVLEFSQMNELYAIAENNHSLLHIAFHAAFAKDINWFLLHKNEIIPFPYRKITCEFFDPYMINGIIQDERISLGGCYIDSGVNALSVCDRLVSLSSFILVSHDELKQETQNSTVYHSNCVFQSNECNILIKTAWDKGINKKHTILEFKDTSDIIDLDHSEQSVKLFSSGNQRILYQHNKAERLLTHYCGVFQDYYNTVQDGKTNQGSAIEIHRLLLS